jgi:hypothetical protein
MAIDSSPKAAPIRQCNAISIPSVGTKKKRKSRLYAVMENIASSIDDRSDSDDGDCSVDVTTIPAEVLPQEGSLAVALGMAVEPSPKATAIWHVMLLTITI